MIIYENGDVLKALRDGQVDVVAHGVNCSGGFGSGIAKQIAEQFPIVRNYYMKAFREGDWYLGKIQEVRIPMTNKDTHKKRIINCATQQFYGKLPESQPNGRYCDYDAIRVCMRQLANHYKDLRIGMPMIGAGLANGDWSVIETIINEEFGDKPVYVYRL